MTLFQETGNKLYTWIRPRLSPQLKVRVRDFMERFLDVWELKYFSQFGEDAFLHRYFEGKSGGPVSQGFYVDVGAYSPKQHSNTYLFYKLGWRGINIEATPGAIARIRRFRPRDISIEALVSDRESEVDFYWWDMPGATNTPSPFMAAEGTRNLGREPNISRIKSVPLAKLLDKHLPPNQLIDFMSVDVEGHDLEVLQSNNWERYRPEIVLVENLEVHAPAELTTLEMSRFMSSQRYVLYAWVRPNLVFRDTDADSTEVRLNH